MVFKSYSVSVTDSPFINNNVLKVVRWGGLCFLIQGPGFALTLLCLRSRGSVAETKGQANRVSDASKSKFHSLDRYHRDVRQYIGEMSYFEAVGISGRKCNIEEDIDWAARWLSESCINFYYWYPWDDTERGTTPLTLVDVTHGPCDIHIPIEILGSPQSTMGKAGQFGSLLQQLAGKDFSSNTPSWNSSNYSG